jgi:hypothetical protein
VSCQCRLLAWYEAILNVMAHAQKPDFVLRREGRVHFNRQGRQFIRLLAAEVCASAVIVGSNAGYNMFRGSVKATYLLRSLVSPSLPLLCVTVCHHISTGVYKERKWSSDRVLTENVTVVNKACIYNLVLK